MPLPMSLPPGNAPTTPGTMDLQTEMQTNPEGARQKLLASGMAPEQVEYLLQAAAGGRELTAGEAALKRMQDQQDAIATPEGRQAGRVYVAANPLEHVGSLMQKYRMGKLTKAEEERLKGLRTGVSEREQAYGKSVLGVE